MKKVLSIFVILVVLIAVVAGGALAIFYSQYKNAIDTPASEDGDVEVVEFRIQYGETTEEISANLLEAGLISSELYFKVYVKLEGLGDKFQAGTFRLAPDLTIKEICEELQHAEFLDVVVTIPEALMASEITTILTSAFEESTDNKFSRDEFDAYVANPVDFLDLGFPIPEGKPLEGYIFPDTYSFPHDSTAHDVLTTILTQGFKTKIVDAYEEEIEASDYTLYEILNLASILERETIFYEDRAKVADILLRRLNDGWRLEVDATLLYHFGDWKHEITYQDLEVDSPYNTRKVGGLPPTPICNPGVNTVEGILYPEENDYWFYISDENGTLHYAKTLEEHNQNINKYLQ